MDRSPLIRAERKIFPLINSPLPTSRLFVSCCSCETQRCSLLATCNPPNTPRQIPRLQLERAFLFYLFIRFAQKTSFYSFHFSLIFHFYTQFYLRLSVLLHFIIIILINFFALESSWFFFFTSKISSGRIFSSAFFANLRRSRLLSFSFVSRREL